MNKPNCWEAMGCGREPGGTRAAEFGVCCVTTEQRLNGLNGGVNGGRACWTMMRRQANECEPYGAATCALCAFFDQVGREEGTGFSFAPDTLREFTC